MHCLRTTTTGCHLDTIMECADEGYDRLKETIKQGREISKDLVDVSIQKYRQYIHRMSITEVDGKHIILIDDRRIVVPENARSKVLKELHRSHSGMTKTSKLASQLFFWPTMNNEISQLIRDCKTCQEDRPRQARTEPTSTPPSTAQYPMRCVGSDLFDA